MRRKECALETQHPGYVSYNVQPCVCKQEKRKLDSNGGPTAAIFEALLNNTTGILSGEKYIINVKNRTSIK